MTRASWKAGTSVKRRFYFSDGHIEHHRVTLDRDGYEPIAWKLMEHAPLDLRLGTIEHEYKIMPSSRTRTFEIKRYEYDLDFIGPRRDADYHET